MQHKLISFARDNGLLITPQTAEKLLGYARRVLEKKAQLNLTGANTLEEIVYRHLGDGIIGASKIAQLASKSGQENFTVVDAGAGAGFIGLTIAAVLPTAQVILVESLTKRCVFLNWIILQEKFTNVLVKNVRLGQQFLNPADYVTERAMGQLPDILPICLSIVKPGGVFVAYQGQTPQTEGLDPSKYGADWEGIFPYQLVQDKLPKHLVLCRKRV